MNISFVIYSLGSGGAERVITGLANYWSHEHNITVITLIKSHPFYALNNNIQLKHCLTFTPTETNLLKSFKNAWLRLRRLTNHLKSDQASVVISFMLTSNIYAIWACKWLKIPCIISERANHAIYLIPASHRFIRNISYLHTDCLVVQTVGNAEYYTKYLSSEKITIVPNAVSSELEPKRLISNNSPKKTILNVGSFKNGKAQDVLIRAFAQLPEQDWHLVFVGKGPNLEKFKTLARQLGVSDRVAFKGAQKDVASYYNSATMFVFTSEHEGFPNALLEALYFGLPCISTNCPHGPSDMISDGVNGFLVPIGDEEALTDKMELLMNNKVLRETFGQKAMDSTKKYEMELIAKQWMNVINNVT